MRHSSCHKRNETINSLREDLKKIKLEKWGLADKLGTSWDTNDSLKERIIIQEGQLTKIREALGLSEW